MSAVSEPKKMHTDLEGNEHFQASEAEWADKDIRQKRTSTGNDDGSSWQAVVWLIVLFGCYKLWHLVEDFLTKSGFSEGFSSVSGKIAGAALLVLAITIMVKAGGYRERLFVSLCYLLIAITIGYFA